MSNLPYISIEGVGETPEEKAKSLQIIHPKMVELGYNVDCKEWNDMMIRSAPKYRDLTHLVCSESGLCEYHNHAGGGEPVVFKANQLTQIVNHFYFLMPIIKNLGDE